MHFTIYFLFFMSDPQNHILDGSLVWIWGLSAIWNCVAGWAFNRIL